MSATIYDVARLCGLSIATVSRTFSAPERVREGTRAKVFEAAKALNYYPNAIARAMALQRTDKVAFLICKQGATILDAFYAGICEGIMSRTDQLGYQLLIATADDWRQTAGTAQSKQIQGVILGGDAPIDLVSELQSQNVAIVLANNRMMGYDLPSIVSDERDGIQQAINHFIEKGHRHIAMLSGRFQPYIVGERYNGFFQSMSARGLSVSAADVKMCDANVDSATQAAIELLDQEDRPTAILGTNDVVAAGIMKAARRLGLRMPEDLAVIGVDDSTICNMLEPELTSVHIDCHKMGELCVERLRSVLEGDPDVPRVTVVPSELRIRRSSGD